MSNRYLAAAALVLSVAAQAIAQPSISFFAADANPTIGQAMIRISGNNFWPGYPVGSQPQVLFGLTPAGVISATNTQIIALTPVGEGTKTVTVIAGGTGGGASNGLSYTYDPPVVNAFSPATGGPIIGAFSMTIGGKNFGTSPSVMIGGVPATDVVADHTVIQCTVPAGLGTDKTVIVTASGQASPASGPKFAYAAPTIFGITPSSSNTLGGGPMDIQGLSLGLPGNPLTPSVTIGTFGATNVVVVSPELVRVTIPAGAGTNLPVVLTRAGQSAAAPITFSYSSPVINTVNPPSGATGGGYNVLISGSNFGPLISGQSSVTIGGVAATVTSWGHSSITATVPAGQGLNRPVVVTASGQSSPAATFSSNAPVITNIRPAFGPAAGGGSIIIDGQNFGTSATVMIGGLPATVTSQSHTSLACLAPMRSGATPLANAQVQITVAALPSNISSYSYLCAADFNRTGALEVQDIFDYLSAWFNGCP